MEQFVFPFWADKKMKLKTTRSVMRQREEREKRVDNPVALSCRHMRIPPSARQPCRHAPFRV
jgi:hypothetical protein